MTSVPPEFPDANIPLFPNLSLVRWQEINRRLQEFERIQRQIEHITLPSNLNRLQDAFRAAEQVAENVQRSQDIIGRIQIVDARLPEVFRLAEQAAENVQRWQDNIGGVQISDARLPEVFRLAEQAAENIQRWQDIIGGVQISDAGLQEVVAQSNQAAQLARESLYDSLEPLFETVQLASAQIELPAKGDGEETVDLLVELIWECRAMNENLEGIRQDNQNTQDVNFTMQGLQLAIMAGALLLGIITLVLATGL